MTVHVSGERLDAILAQLRAEEPLETDPAQRALLRYEIGVLEERRGDGRAASREYLAAFDLAPDFREPVEALARLTTITGEDRGKVRMFEALVGAAKGPGESTVALWELAAHRADVLGDLAAARQALEQAVTADPDSVAAWLALELVAARAADVDGRIRALEARARLTRDPTLQGALLVELAHLIADAGDVTRAVKLLDAAAALDGRARFRALVSLENVARDAGALESQAVALESQAELVVATVADPARGDKFGVPRSVRQPAYAAECWLRASLLRRRTSDPWGAVAAARAAARQLSGDALVARMELAAADASGDDVLAMEIAFREAQRGVGGAVGAAMWTRIALAREKEGRLDEAAAAYERALELDPGSAVAEASRLPALLAMSDGATLARALESAARTASRGEAEKAWLLAAFAWGARNGDAAEAQRALDACVQAGMDIGEAARIARSLAATSEDWSWYEAATVRLLAQETELAERASLSFELGRLRLLRGDAAAADAAWSEIAASLEPESWLGRLFMAYGGDPGRARGRAVMRLAELQPDALLARGLVMVAAWLAMHEGANERAIDWLSKEHERAVGDIAIAVLLSEALRAVENFAAAARVLVRLSAALAEPELIGALRIEAGLLYWRAGERHEAVAVLETAIETAPVAARRALAWLLRAANPDERAVRRRVAELQEESLADRPVGALERFGLGVLERGGETDAWAALEQLDELDEGGDLGLATALARVLWASESIDAASVSRSLDHIEALGGTPASLARGERYRQARFVEGAIDASLTAARVWAADDGATHVALSWLASAAAAKSRTDELEARRAIARSLDGEGRAQALASAATVVLLDGRADELALFSSETTAGKLMNLELAPPGAAPLRRIAALGGVGDALGAEAQHQARRLAAWSELACGQNEHAKDAFASLCREDPADVASWEGLRAAADALGDDVTLGAALLQLGTLCRDDARGAELLELAGVTLLERTAAHDDAEQALSRALARDPKRTAAFEALFQRLRQQNQDDALLALITKRIEVTDDTAELARMYWERARVFRRRGDIRAALGALENVAEIEPEHVGALALLGEIRIHAARSLVEQGSDARREFTDAAPVLARLAASVTAPEQQRRVSAVAAADVYEKQLGKPEKAFEVLWQLHRDELATLPVLERVARLAGKIGKWAEAADLLELLMERREDSEGRADAARLAMAIHRDKLRDAPRADRAVARLLEEIPDDPDAIEVVLRAPLVELRPVVMSSGRAAIETRLASHPVDARRVRVLSDIAAAAGQFDAQRAALGVLAAIVDPDEGLRQALLRLDTRVAHVPAIALDDRALATLCDDDDAGPLAELFALIAEVVTAALGPSLRSEAVTRKDRLESGDPLRVDIARWMGAVGFDDFELLLGGRKRRGVAGVAADLPTLIVGVDVQAPLDAGGRAAIAREAFALRRGITAVLHNDEHTIASIVASVSNDVGVAMPVPPLAIYKEVDRAMRKAMSRKLRKDAAELCAQIVETRQDVSAWLAAARRSIDRMALVAAGDAGTVLDAVIGSRGTPARVGWETNPRAISLLRFALSRDYLELRHRLGMGMS
ncbi:MAG: tetratricopeptide repeat protein [Deltaproteobacteria bacterium]|nr:tetratricopeptide repeat protein [Deltaproteobacteria bacterium]